MQRVWLLVVLVLVPGCRLRVSGVHDPVPVSTWMTGDEAVRRSQSYCADRGLACEVDKVRLYDQRWKVKLHARGPQVGKIELEFDAASHRLVKAKDKLKRPKHDDDDDDDHRRRGHDDDDD